MSITYLNGDATRPIGSDSKIIVHICNDIGLWGKGFVLAISKRWKIPEKKYREWYQSKENFSLGEIQMIKVESDIWVANMICQEGIYKNKNDIPPIRYDAVSKALAQVHDFAYDNNAIVHMPRIGCGLAGGNWIMIEEIIQDKLCVNGIDVFVYDF